MIYARRSSCYVNPKSVLQKREHSTLLLFSPFFLSIALQAPSYRLIKHINIPFMQHRAFSTGTDDNTSGNYITSLQESNRSQKQCLRKLINVCMIDGKKSKSILLISNTLSQLANYGNVMELVMNAKENVKPILELKKVRIAGSTQLVPSVLSKGRQDTLAIRWIVEAAKKRRHAKKSLSLSQCLVAEIVDASRKTGLVRRRRDELHKLAEANRGFSHYRWW